MIVFLFSSVALALTPAKPALPASNGKVILDGVEVEVHWDDGDTFMVPSTRLKARLHGYNTLESYGAVHRFGPGETVLRGVADQATEWAKSRVWACSSMDGSGGYGRTRVDCPELRRSLLERGLAHAFVVNQEADIADLDAQQRGVRNKAGMWSMGAPAFIVTSVHSVDEKPGQTETYNRVLDTATGTTTKRKHSNTYAACEWVCESGACLLYVPYAQRYGSKRAACLDGKP